MPGTPKKKKLHPLEDIVLELPLPPSINEQYATVAGHRTSSANARKFMKKTMEIVRQKLQNGEISDDTVDHLQKKYLALDFIFYFETPLRRDLDGGLKIAQDAICDALTLNDNRVVDIHLSKKISPLKPRIEVTISGLDEWEFDEQYMVIKKDSKEEPQK